MKNRFLSAAALALGTTMSATAAIDLQVVATDASVDACDTVRVEVYAVWDGSSKSPDSFSAITAVFGWDPAHLQFLGLDTAASAMSSSSMPAGDPFGVNEAAPPADGDGLYIGFAPVGSPITATKGGVLITTLEFQALTAVNNTPVSILPAAGAEIQVQTIVYDGEVPGLGVTGALGTALIDVFGEGDCGPEEDPCPWDLNDDGGVDVTDLVQMILVWGSDDAAADVNDDGVVSVLDLIELVTHWGPCDAK